ncbi:MAG: type I 3-dehydroquinate dehydratase [Thermodesulfobacteriota bacterium]
MKRSLKDKNGRKVCLPIVEKTVKNALKAIKEANWLADLIELRMDYLRDSELGPLLNAKEKPLIVTNRRREEGGKYGSDEKSRFRILREAVESGAEYVDVEMRSEKPLLRELIANKKKTRIVLSLHDFRKTPSPAELKKLFNRMAQIGGDVIKIVSFARSWEDNPNILSLIPYAQEKEKEIVAFCMGERGKMSRIFAPFMGAAWTYAALSKGKTSAPGQLTIWEMKEIWERLK